MRVEKRLWDKIWDEVRRMKKKNNSCETEGLVETGKQMLGAKRPVHFLHE